MTRPVASLAMSPGLRMVSLLECKLTLCFATADVPDSSWGVQHADNKSKDSRLRLPRRRRQTDHSDAKGATHYML